uniref:Peroxin 4 n=1 Tax=Nephromyces sp. MMRI TaxID=2496275 RepID=A0A3Q8UBL2_9APIC|nr:peroxin 4 [Nephromyces sp. MMRI]AZL94326.1 peroxin 4 [Nephromyces sp. MMRI]
MDSRQRLLREYKEYQKSPDEEITLTILEDNLFEWVALVNGPTNSPFENGKWKLKIKCPSNYPISPPSIHFVTKCFHPNVDFKSGEVCLDILKTSWSPVWTLQYLCRAIITLLSEPNADSPLNCDAGNLIRSGDMRGFNSMARMYTIESALQTTL